MASTLYIQIPSKTMTDTMENCFQQDFPYCVASTGEDIVEQGFKSLADLTSVAQSVQQVILLLAASDVHFVSVKVPPLPLAKLRAALPNILEDQVLTDPSQLMFICQTPKNGKALVAIVSRSWMETLEAQTQVLNVRKLSAFALSTSMQKPNSEDVANVLLEVHDSTIELSFNSMTAIEQQASGMTMHIENPPHFPEIFYRLRVLAPASQLNLYVDNQWQASCLLAAQTLSTEDQPIQIKVLNWPSKIAGVDAANIDLLSILFQEGKQSIDWQRWRLTIILASVALLIAMLGLNWKWWKLNNEAKQLRASLMTSYKNTFPKDRVFRDPIVQMQQNIDSSKKAAGQSTNDDFVVLTSQFSQSWDALAGASGATVQFIEYKDKSLYIKPAESVTVNMEQLRQSLKEHALKVDMNDGIYKVSVDRGDTR